MSVQHAGSIADTVRSWSGVTTGDNGRLGVEFRVGKIELGHMHGHNVAHLPMPKRLRDDLVATGQATPHPVLPHSGWIQVTVTTPDDARSVIDLFRQNYERAINRRQ